MGGTWARGRWVPGAPGPVDPPGAATPGPWMWAEGGPPGSVEDSRGPGGREGLAQLGRGWGRGHAAQSGARPVRVRTEWLRPSDSGSAGRRRPGLQLPGPVTLASPGASDGP